MLSASLNCEQNRLGLLIQKMVLALSWVQQIMGCFAAMENFSTLLCNTGVLDHSATTFG